MTLLSFSCCHASKCEGEHITLIFRFIFLFWLTDKIGLQALMLKKNHSLLILPSAAPLSLSPLKLSDIAPCLFKCLPPKYAVSSDWSAHTCLTHNIHNHFFSPKVDTVDTDAFFCATVQHDVFVGPTLPSKHLHMWVVSKLKVRQR